MPRTVRIACLISLSLGLLFVFVRAPHPWGWNGFDHYHELALELAAGRTAILIRNRPLAPDELPADIATRSPELLQSFYGAETDENFWIYRVSRP